MKELKDLDKTIINGDVKHFAYLLQTTDCKGAVLIHLKEALVPEYFSEIELREKGAILNLEQLHADIQKYSHGVISDNAITKDNIDKTIKSLYFTGLHAVKMWQKGRFTNQEVESMWDLEAISYLASKWIRKELPKSLQEYARAREADYNEHKYHEWRAQSLSAPEVKNLDGILLQALRTNWNAGDETDLVCQQIGNNIFDETLELCRSNKEEAFTKDVLAAIRKKVTDQIFDGSINKELIKNALEEEKARILKDNIAPNLITYYEQAMANLFAKWQDGSLEAHVNDDVNAYIKKQLATYPLPGSLKAAMLENAIPQVLAQYRNGELPAELHQRLIKQFKQNIIGYCEKNSEKDTPYREELSQVIFTKLLADWKSGQLPKEASAYLKKHLLSDLQNSLKGFGLPTSRFNLFLLIRGLQADIASLSAQVQELRAEKTVAFVKVSESGSTANSNNDEQPSLALAAQQSGIFKPVAPAASSSTATTLSSLLPTFGSK